MASALEADTEELHAVAASLAAAAQTLAGLPPLNHPPIAADEVSTSAAARFTAHGAVLGSRAADAAAVLASAAQALQEAARAYTDMDRANASAVSLRGNPGFAGAAMTPAATANMAALFVPIRPPAPRDGEQAAALLEAGNPDAGAAFTSGCASYAGAFRRSADSARGGQATVLRALQGHAGPRAAAALGRFGDWAEQMGEHCDTVETLAHAHKGRFLTTRQDTPSTHDFATTRQELANADELNRRTRGAYTGVVTKLQSDLAALHTRASVAAENYHLGELPAAPPPPPPVAAIVTDQPAPASPPGAGDGQPGDHHGKLSPAVGDAPGADPLPQHDVAGTHGLGGPGGADQMAQALPMMAASLPSMLAGALGGVVGMAASVPEQIAQQVGSLASEAVQGVGGLSGAMGKPDIGDAAKDAPAAPGDVGRPGGAGDVGGDAAGGGDGGVTDPAAGSAMLPSGGAMMAAGTPPTPTPLVGQAATTEGVPGAAAGPGGMPMMMGGMGGMGAGSGAGARPVKDPDKTIHLPADPNAAPVKGDVVRRPTAVTEDPTDERKPAAPVKVTTSQGRRISLPKDDRGQ